MQTHKAVIFAFERWRGTKTFFRILSALSLFPRYSAHMCSVSFPITYQTACLVTVLNFTRFFICCGIRRPGCFPSLSAPGWIVYHVGSSTDLPPRFFSPLSPCGLPLPSLCPHQFWPGRRPGYLTDWCSLGTGVSGFQEAAVSVRW